MTFSAPFSRVITRPFGGVPSGSAWWLSGGIAAVNCVAAYAPKGAADYATSKVNLANPGTYDLSDGTAYPSWNILTGWTFTGTEFLKNTTYPNSDTDFTFAVRINSASTSTAASTMFSTARNGTEKHGWLIRIEQYNSTGKIGITAIGTGDYVFDIATPTSGVIVITKDSTKIKCWHGESSSEITKSIPIISERY